MEGNGNGIFEVETKIPRTFLKCLKQQSSGKYFDLVRIKVGQIGYKVDHNNELLYLYVSLSGWASPCDFMFLRRF